VVHHCGDEGAWWNITGIDPTVAASAPWLETHPLAMAGDKMREVGSIATVGTDRGNGKRDRLLSESGPNYETNPISRQRQTRLIIADYWLPQHSADKFATPTSTGPCQQS
jgi:hypothetical protein